MFVPRTGHKIQCKVEVIDVDDRTFDYESESETDERNRRELSRKAVGIVSQNMNILNVKEFIDPRKDRRKEGNETFEMENVRAVDTEAILDELDFLKL